MIKLAKIFIITGAALVVFLVASAFLHEIFIINDTTHVIILLICISLYSTGYVILFLKRNAIDISKTANSVGLQAIVFTIFGVYYKSLHLPNAGIILTISIFLLAFIYAPLNFKLKYGKWQLYTRSKRDAFLLCLFDLLGIVIVLFAILFKFQHWFGAGVLIIAGAIIVPISVFAWNQKFKKEIIYRKNAEDKLNDTLNELKLQKNAVEEKNYILKQQNEEIQTINHALNEQKEIIEEKNAELKAQNEEIAAQRDMLAAQNQAISESILYAKRIQTAVMPQHAYIDEILPENFILYKPRDVVSGDFYWIRQINHTIVIAVADCTGHGVPGAIMSVLGISLLNEIVQKREITQANMVLNELRKQLKHALKQTGREGAVEDGMDMALCALNIKSKQLQFAGANNSLYLVQVNELIEIQPDTMPIGFYPNEKTSFTNHEMALNDGDVFYLFTDGIIDQFGGEKGQKFKAANFQKILLEIHDKPMQIQKEKLEQHLAHWMKGHEQTDDILVMGVRV